MNLNSNNSLENLQGKSKKLKIKKRPSFLWEQGDYEYYVGVENYLDNADTMRRISLQNSQFFPETEFKLKRGVIRKDSKKRFLYGIWETMNLFILLPCL